MPAYIMPCRSVSYISSKGTAVHHSRTSIPNSRSVPIKVGLINNMPDGALDATEHQFLSLLDAASGNSFEVSLFLYFLPEIRRSTQAGNHIQALYSNVEDLWDCHLDGLIVTGREPLTSNLSDEPYWNTFTKIFEWAGEHTYSTIWSCLAAHAAIFYEDGIGRLKNDRKFSGVFECDRISNHPLTSGMPSRFHMPHSRWNGLAEDAIARCGYHMLSHTPFAGVDAFIKEHNSLFVFFQGHPEYSADALLLEYRRDVGRYLGGTASAYPSIPRDYFARDTIEALITLQHEAILRPRKELMTELSNVLANTEVKDTWRATATSIYRNWLNYIQAQRHTRTTSFERTPEQCPHGRLLPVAAA